MWLCNMVKTNVLADFFVISNRLNACHFQSSVLSALITPPCFMITRSWEPSGRFYLNGVNLKVLSFNVHGLQPEAPHSITMRGLLLVGLK